MQSPAFGTGITEFRNCGWLRAFNSCSRSKANPINCGSRRNVLYISIPAGRPLSRIPTGSDRLGYPETAGPVEFVRCGATIASRSWAASALSIPERDRCRAFVRAAT